MFTIGNIILYAIEIVDHAVKCTADAFQCKHGTCKEEWASDDEYFGRDEEDEEDEDDDDDDPYNLCIVTSPCIPLSWRCNLKAECTDSSDEAECDGKCIFFCLQIPLFSNFHN